MNAIVAVDKNWAIGYQNKLMFHIKEDMKRFKEMTTGNMVVMGRKTFESMGSKPLPNRVNIVLTRDQNYQNDGVFVVHDFSELLEYTQRWDPTHVFLIGGDSLYHQLIDYCKFAFVTKVENSYPFDATFPDLDEKKNWKILSDEYPDEPCSDGVYHYVTYVNLEQKIL